jgi:hypothetical protein
MREKLILWNEIKKLSIKHNKKEMKKYNDLMVKLLLTK